MGIEDSEQKHPIFEVDGYPIQDFKVIDTKNAVTFSFLVQSDHTPTPEDLRPSELIDKAGGWDLLKKKNWINEQMKVLVPLKQKRECTFEGNNTFSLNFTFTRKDRTSH
jgi:hypothetical protein